MPILQVSKAGAGRVRKAVVVHLSPDERAAPGTRLRHYARGQRGRPNTTPIADPIGAQGQGWTG
jgi:hypothetical protein